MGYKDVSRSNPSKSTHVLAIINQKGGVGKSTTAIDLSAALSEEGKKCLLLDFDPQGNSTSGYGIDKDSLKHDIYDVLMDGFPANEAIVATPEKKMWLIPATIQLAGAEIELVSKIARESTLKGIVDTVKDDFDYIFIDCPPSLGLLTLNALTAANGLLIPIQCEYYALEGVAKLLESVKLVRSSLNKELKIYGVLMTMYDKRTTLSNQVVDEVRNYFGKLVFKTLIPRSVKISEAPSHGLPISLYAHMNKGAIAYRNLAREVIRRG